jgi:hypothetical protein
MDAVATARLALDASGLDRGLKSAQSSVASFAKQAGQALAAGFAFNKIVQGFASAIEKGDQLQDIAEKFGVSASKLQLLGNAASVFGSGIEQVSAGLNKLSLAQQKALADDTGLAKTFKEVGISITDLKTMRPEDILLRISDSFASGANNGRQFIIVNELLGKAQTDLIKVLNQGSAAIIKQGESIGIFTDEEIANLSEASDAIKLFENNVTIGFGKVAALINPLIGAFRLLAQEISSVGGAMKDLAGGQMQKASKELIPKIVSAAKNYKGGLPSLNPFAFGNLVGGKFTGAFAQSNQPKAKQASKTPVTPVMTDDLELASITEEKKKQDKKLFHEELYDLQEASRLEASRDKTLFDRMMRDAEFNRDEKKRILALEKGTAEKNREIIMRGMEASGTILDKARASAERLGNFNLVNQIDRERGKQQRETDVSLLQGLGARPDSFGRRTNEQVSALTQTEGNLQRSQNSELLKSFTDMQGLVNRISAQIDKRLGVPILRTAN